MPPSGGEARAGFALTEDRVEDTRRTSTGGDARLEIAATYLGSDLAVIAAIERQHGQVGGLPAQDWSLRLTLVFQRDGQGSPWRMVHRHADPLVRQIPNEHLAVLARGLDTETPPPAR